MNVKEKADNNDNKQNEGEIEGEIYMQLKDIVLSSGSDSNDTGDSYIVDFNMYQHAVSMLSKMEQSTMSTAKVTQNTQYL